MKMGKADEVDNWRIWRVMGIQEDERSESKVVINGVH